MKKIFYQILKNNQNIFLFLFKYLYFLQIIPYCKLSKCNNIDLPLLKGEECIATCTSDEISKKICIIDNEIIKIQWLNNIVYLTYEYTYINVASSTENNNLYFLSSEFPASNNRFLYLLNNEGYGLLDVNNPIKIIEIDDPLTKGRFDSEIFLVKLYESDDDKEYLTSISIADQNIEIYELDSEKYYYDRINKIFGDLINIYTSVGVHLKLNSAMSDNKNTYLIGILACEYPGGKEEEHFYLRKVNFTSINIQKTPPSYDAIDVACSRSKIVSCYETDKFFIVCFYQDKNYKYTIIVYDYNLNKKVSKSIATGSSDDGYENWFFKCIHFFGETGVFGYFDSDKLFNFEFKIYFYNNNTIANKFSKFKRFRFDNYAFSQDKVTLCDMIKIKDKKFYFVGVSYDKNFLIISTFYKYYEDKFSVRTYKINTKILYDYLFVGDIRIILYKNFLTLVSNYKNLTNDYIYSSLIIFSYPNTKEEYLDIYNYLYKNNDIKIYNLTLEIYEKQDIIDNNIFGYAYSGIEIAENCLDLEDIYLVDSNDEKISNDYFLKKSDKIKLFIQKQKQYSTFNCIFKYAVVVSEPEFSEFNKYPKEYNDTGTNKEENFFEHQNYIGKYNYYNISLSQNLTEIGCPNKCDLCNQINPEICITCNNFSYYDENNNKLCELNIINTNSPSAVITIKEKTETIINDSDDLNCSLINIIRNKCSEDLTPEQGKEVYSYLKSNLINKNYTLVKTSNMIFQISSFGIEINLEEMANIDLGECETRLKEENNISESEDLIIFQIDIKDLNKTKTYVQYEVYEPNEFRQMNLDICEDLIINIYCPISLDNETLLIFSSLNEEGYNLFDPNDAFYNDFCTPYTTLNGTDIILNDRKNDIYNQYGNISLCQEKCKFEYYNETSQKIKCSCNSQTEDTKIILFSIEFTKEEIMSSFYEALSNSNFKVLKCYKLAFDFSSFFKNIGRILMSIIIIILIVLVILYCILGKKKLKKYFDDILALKIIKKKQLNKDLLNYNSDKKNKNKKIKVKKYENFLTNIFDINNKKQKKKNKNITWKKNKSSNKLPNMKNSFPPKKVLNSNSSSNNFFNINNKNSTSKRNNLFNINRNSLSKINNIPNINKNSLNKKNSFKKNLNFNSSSKIIYTSIDRNSLNNKKNLSKNIYTEIKNKNNKIQKSNYKNSENKYFKNKVNNKIENIINKEKIFGKINNYFTNEELNTMSYEDALKFDKRTYLEYYWSLLKKKQLILFALINNDDYNLKTLKIALFFISFSLFMTINTFFFSDSTMHNIYQDNGSYNVIKQIPIMIYSTLISTVINMLFKTLSLSEKKILEIKTEKIYQLAKEQSIKSFFCIKIRILIFFTICFIFISFFWYFISCFCAVYINTQKILINDTLIDFGLSMLYPFGFSLLPGIFRIPSLKDKKRARKCLYKISIYISWI